MATQSVEFRAATGLTITAKLFAFGSDTEAASVTATEATNRKGTYTAAYTDVAAGEYQLIALSSGSPVASWWTTLAASTATYEVYDKANKLAIADAVLSESILDHKNVAHSLAKYIYQIKQATLTIDGIVSTAITPTTLTFSSNVAATTSAYAHAVLLFISGPLAGENSPIISYTSTNGVFVLEEPLTAAPSDGDEFVVIAGSHVHAIADIQAGLALEATSQSIKAKTDNLPSDPADASEITAAFTEIKGAGWSSTDTLKEISDAAGAGNIMVTPVVAQVPVRVVGTNIETFIGDLSNIRVGIFSGSDPVNLTNFGDLEVCVQSKTGSDLDFIEMADLTIDGDDSNYVSWTPNGPSVETEGRYKWSLRKSSNKQVIAYGAWIIVDAALEDTGS